MFANGQTTILNSTIVNNDGGLQNSLATGSARIANSIIAGNRQPNGIYRDCTLGGGTIKSNGFNLFGAGTGCPVGATDRTVASTAVLTTVLGPLADNGGAALTHALLPGSPALDAASTVANDVYPNCTSHDERFLPRPQEATASAARCDMGAFEQQTPLPAPAH